MILLAAPAVAQQAEDKPVRPTHAPDPHTIDQADDEPATNPSASRPPAAGRPFELTLRGTYFTPADGDRMNVGLSRAAVRAGTRFPLNAQLLLALGVEWEHSFYNFDGLENALPGATDGEIDGLDSYSTSVGLNYLASKQWSYFGLASASISGDSGADIGDALRFGGLGGVRYAFSPRLAARLGIGAFTQLEDNVIVLPVIGIEWKPDTKWDINLGLPETGVAYHATRSLDLFLRGALEFKDYRLSGDGLLDDAVFRDHGIGFAVGTTWAPAESISFEVGLGATFDRSISIDNRNGDELIDEDLKPSAFGSLAVKFRF